MEAFKLMSLVNNGGRMKKILLTLVVAGITFCTIFPSAANARPIGFDDFHKPAKTYYGPWKRVWVSGAGFFAVYNCTRTVYLTNGKTKRQTKRWYGKAISGC